MSSNWNTLCEEKKENNRAYRKKDPKRYQILVAKSMLKTNGIILCKHCHKKIEARLEELKEEKLPDKKPVLEEIV